MQKYIDDDDDLDELYIRASSTVIKLCIGRFGANKAYYRFFMHHPSINPTSGTVFQFMSYSPKGDALIRKVGGDVVVTIEQRHLMVSTKLKAITMSGNACFVKTYPDAQKVRVIDLRTEIHKYMLNENILTKYQKIKIIKGDDILRGNYVLKASMPAPTMKRWYKQSMNQAFITEYFPKKSIVKKGDQ